MAEYVTIRYRHQGRGKLVRVEGVWTATEDGFVCECEWESDD